MLTKADVNKDGRRFRVSLLNLLGIFDLRSAHYDFNVGGGGAERGSSPSPILEGENGREKRIWHRYAENAAAELGARKSKFVSKRINYHHESMPSRPFSPLSFPAEQKVLFLLLPTKTSLSLSRPLRTSEYIASDSPPSILCMIQIVFPPSSL